MRTLETDIGYGSQSVGHQHTGEIDRKVDKWGIGLSAICAVHCLLTPVAVIALPFLGHAFESVWSHLLMALFVGPVAYYAFFTRPTHKLVKALGGIGLLFILAGLSIFIFPHSHLEEGHLLTIERILTSIGGVFLITAHYKNMKYGHCPTCLHDHEH